MVSENKLSSGSDTSQWDPELYQQTLSWLFSQLPMFSRVGAAAYKPGLDTSLQLDEYFGHPHRRFKAIHIAGTNGKGSTSHSIASMLQEEGYKVGLYTSPHLADFRERMRINGEMIPKEAVVDFIQRFRNSGYAGHPSFFELTMMMAFTWFAEQEVDYAVIEVGMGGRLDSTNIITPILSVITNISPDHTQFLGSTLPQIAAEKAGIIKEGIPVVVGEADNPDVREVFASTAARLSSPIVFASDSPLLIVHEKDLCENIKAASPGGLQCESSLCGKFTFPLCGDYQRHNINTALHAASALQKSGISLSGESIRRGLERIVSNTGLRGRWEILGRSPLRICDTGHNLAGLTHNLRQLSRLLASSGAPEPKLRMVIGFVSDKDVAHIAPLFPKEAVYYFTQASVPRAMPVTELAALLESHGLHGRSFPDVPAAYAAALADSQAAHPAGTPNPEIIFIGGSTFVVADLLASL